MSNAPAPEYKNPSLGAFVRELEHHRNAAFALRFLCEAWILNDGAPLKKHGVVVRAPTQLADWLGSFFGSAAEYDAEKMAKEFDATLAEDVAAFFCKLLAASRASPNATLDKTAVRAPIKKMLKTLYAYALKENAAGA